MFYQIIDRDAGLIFLSPVPERFRGHSLWRIYNSLKAASYGHHETAAWLLTHPKTISGPEHAANTAIPRVNATPAQRLPTRHSDSPSLAAATSV